MLGWDNRCWGGITDAGVGQQMLRCDNIRWGGITDAEV